jgi:hypothetical protein
VEVFFRCWHTNSRGVEIVAAEHQRPDGKADIEFFVAQVQEFLQWAEAENESGSGPKQLHLILAGVLDDVGAEGRPARPTGPAQENAATSGIREDDEVIQVHKEKPTRGERVYRERKNSPATNRDIEKCLLKHCLLVMKEDKREKGSPPGRTRAPGTEGKPTSLPAGNSGAVSAEPSDDLATAEGGKAPDYDASSFFEQLDALYDVHLKKGASSLGSRGS